jgi:hypothetical protein
LAIFAAIRRASSLLSSLAADRLARLSIGLRHTIGAAAKYSQFCLFEVGQLLRVSGDCEGPHAGSHSENLSASRNFDARGSCALRGRQRNLCILVRRLTLRCVQCGTDLVAPVRSEYWSDNHACHIWHCPKCCACFSSLVCFSDDTDTEPLRRYNFRLCATASGAWRYSPQSAAPHPA